MAQRRDAARDDDPLPIDAFLRGLGFGTPAALRTARGVLERAGLTRAGKQALAAYKRPAAEAALDAALVRVCGRECAVLAKGVDASAREPVVTASATCEICGGSNNRRAALACARELRRNGVRELLVVGGTAPQQHELAQLLASDDVRIVFVDGTSGSHSQKDAVARMNRAQLLVIWGSTPLRHAVSNLYTDEPPPHLRVITVARRGIEALCGEIVRSYAGKAGRRR